MTDQRPGLNFLCFHEEEVKELLRLGGLTTDRIVEIMGTVLQRNFPQRCEMVKNWNAKPWYRRLITWKWERR